MYERVELLLVFISCAFLAVSAGRDPAKAFAQDVTHLKYWMAKQGGFVDPRVDVQRQAMAGTDARGLVAARPIDKGERLASIPEGAFVDPQRMLADPLVGEVQRILENQSASCKECYSVGAKCWDVCSIMPQVEKDPFDVIAIAAWLVKEQSNVSSTFHPWLKLLPKIQPGALHHLSQAQLKEALGGTEALQEMQQMQQAWQLAHELLQQSELYRRHVDSYSSFAHARHIVMSRTHSRRGLGRETEVLLPFFDLLNHEEHPTAVWNFDSDKNEFHLHAAEPIDSGRAITVSYGEGRDNRGLLVRYGFVIPGNVHHHVPLDFTLEKSNYDDLVDAKQDALVAAGLLRPFRFAAREGWAPSIFDQDGSHQERDAANLGALLANLRLATISRHELSALPTHFAKGLLEENEKAIEMLKVSHAVATPEHEGRAARRLELTCLGALSEMCSTGCDAAGLLEKMRLAGGDVDGLQDAASVAADYVSWDRHLYTSVAEVARGVQQLVKDGSWPNTAGAPATLGPLAKRELDKWATSYKDSVDARQKHQEL